MKLPMKWAQSYAQFTTTPQEFADKMTMSGSKVEWFACEADKMKNVVLGRIDEIVRHPDSDHLWICQVNVGGETVQIVTGAQNLTGGEMCPVALHGAKLPNGTEIKKGKLRGVESNGMLCSLSELGLTTHDFPSAAEDGILVLHPEDLTPGQDTPGTGAAEALGMDDVVFEFEITPNRPDCLSVRGLAREAAATFGVPFVDHVPPNFAVSSPTGSAKISQMLRVKVDAHTTCNRYSAAVVDNVRVKPSPRWLRERLRLAGVRPINNIVDITNYVMLEYGQPMHAFDYAFVNGAAITVRMAHEGESIVTLDGGERPLDSGMMVIADEKGPIAVAGVMGGEHSGVYATTKRVIFESACFDGPSVRATAKRLGMRTESSGRFEKGLNPDNAGPALRRALELVAELDAGDIVEGILDEYPAPRAERTIALQADAINRLLGIEISRERMIEILLPLGFRIEQDTVHVPTDRYDVTRFNDLAEEIARFVGYNNMPSTMLVGAAEARLTERQAFTERMCDVLVGYGLWECETFSFYSPKSFDMIRLPVNSPLRDAVKILHPLGEDTSIMRTTALPSLLEVSARNWASRNEEAALFELATEYLPHASSGELPIEQQKIIIAAYGDTWDYSSLKGVTEGLAASAGIANLKVRRIADNPSYHPGRCAEIWVHMPSSVSENDTGETKKDAAQPMQRLAILGEIHPESGTNYGIKPRVVAAEICFNTLFACRGATPQFKPLPRFPASTRDLALVADEATPAADIAACITKAAGKLLESLTLFDIYTGERVGAGKKSLAYSLVLRDANATLTDEDADRVTAKTLKLLAEIGVVLRS